jgi:hypothetical protein
MVTSFKHGRGFIHKVIEKLLTGRCACDKLVLYTIKFLVCHHRVTNKEWIEMVGTAQIISTPLVYYLDCPYCLRPNRQRVFRTKYVLGTSADGRVQQAGYNRSLG